MLMSKRMIILSQWKIWHFSKLFWIKNIELALRMRKNTGYFQVFSLKIKCLMNELIFLEFNSYTKLRRVKISFGTPTFDKITKDQKANFATKLSTIGGTMGLLTGFSVISGVEFLFFFARIFLTWIRSLMDKMKGLKQVSITKKKDDDQNKVVSLA